MPFGDSANDLSAVEPCTNLDGRSDYPLPQGFGFGRLPTKAMGPTINLIRLDAPKIERSPFSEKRGICLRRARAPESVVSSKYQAPASANKAKQPPV